MSAIVGRMYLICVIVPLTGPGRAICVGEETGAAASPLAPRTSTVHCPASGSERRPAELASKSSELEYLTPFSDVRIKNKELRIKGDKLHLNGGGSNKSRDEFSIGEE